MPTDENSVELSTSELWSILDNLPVAKTCVFCGEVPKERTKEHVFPRWLIKLGGDQRRTVFAGHRIDANGDSQALFVPFDAISCPACAECNHRLGHLEACAQTVVKKITASKPIDYNEMRILFDWLDKIRLGHWIASLLRSGNTFELKPKYRIISRMGKSDCALWIFKGEHPNNKVFFNTSDDPVFWHDPSFLHLYVNGWSFVFLATYGCIQPLVQKEVDLVRPDRDTHQFATVKRARNNPKFAIRSWPLHNQKSVCVVRPREYSTLAQPGMRPWETGWSSEVACRFYRVGTSNDIPKLATSLDSGDVDAERLASISAHTAVVQLAKVRHWVTTYHRKGCVSDQARRFATLQVKLAARMKDSIARADPESFGDNVQLAMSELLSESNLSQDVQDRVRSQMGPGNPT